MSFQVLLTGFAVETLRSKYLKSFTLQNSKQDYVRRDAFEDVSVGSGGGGEPIVKKKHLNLTF